jgi:hypothetical protein
MQELYNVLVYPHHRNVSLLHTDRNYVSVGIGPLSYSSDYVKIAEPLPSLKNDIRFIAHRMKLECPPLHIASREEIELYTALLRAGPSRPTDRNWHEWAKVFLQKANGLDIFPKLPSMLKSYHKHWICNKKNQSYKANVE